MINVRQLVLGSVASPEITPLPGSQHPAYETKLLDPVSPLTYHNGINTDKSPFKALLPRFYE
jgi:hypothetical protein